MIPPIVFKSIVRCFLLVVALMFPLVSSPPHCYPANSTNSQNRENVYVGSAKSNKYHRRSCQWAQKINRHNLVGFNSKGDAVSNGYIPCKVCRP